MKVRRVFLLGAGASKSWGLPLTNELFPLALTGVPRQQDREQRGHSFSMEDTKRIRNQLLLAIPDVLHGARAKAAHSSVRKFASLLRPGDTIVTFNWDLLLEEGLHDLGKDWEYCRSEDNISILKPHGSIDWFKKSDVETIKEELLFPLNKQFGEIQVFRRFRAPKIPRVVPVILPPVVNKKIVHEELEAIWRDAWLALRYADEIYIIGYSLPPEDLHARITIRSSIRANERVEGHRLKIAIVSPDRNVYLRFSRLVEGTVKYYESKLEGISLNEMVSSG